MTDSPNQGPAPNPFMRHRLTLRQALLLNASRLLLRVLGRLSPDLAGKLALHLFTTPPTFPPNKGEQKLDDHSDIAQLDIYGRRIAIRSWGAGPVVLFSHGWGGRGVHFHALIEALVRRGL